MSNVKTVLIASTSNSIVGLTVSYLKESGVCDYSVVGVLNDIELKACLQMAKPEYLFIEGGFYQGATPDELLLIVKKNVRLKVFVFDFHEYPDYFLKSIFRAGVEGFLDMRQEKSALMQDLKRALTGKEVIPKQFEGMNFAYLPAQDCNLTSRDMEFVHLIICGYMDREIAEYLHLKLQTVKNRRKALYEKLHAVNVLDFLRQVIIKGVIELDEFLHR